MAKRKSPPWVIKAIIAIPLTIGSIVGGYFLYKKLSQDKDTVDIDYDPALAGRYWDHVDEVWRDDGPSWEPSALAAQLVYAMDTFTLPMTGATLRSRAWYDLGHRHLEGIKYLHNYWNENLTDKESLYEWVNDEITLPGSLEENAQQYALSRMTTAGISGL